MREKKRNIQPTATVKDVIHTGSFSEKVSKESGVEKLIFTVPLTLRNQIIGGLEIQFNSKDVDQGLKDFFVAISQQLAVSLENARKLEETQSRSGSDHLIRDITTKVQSYTSVDDILKSAALELGRSLGISEVNIGLVTPEDKTLEG